MGWHHAQPVKGLRRAEAPYLPGRSELAESASATALVFDAAAQMFWKNIAARSFPEAVPAMGRHPVVWDLPADVSAGAPLPQYAITCHYS